MGDHLYCEAPTESTWDRDEEPTACYEPFVEAGHAAELGHTADALWHDAHAGSHVAPPAPVDEEPIVTSETATGSDLQDIMSAVLDERAATRPPIRPPVRAPVSPDMACMVDDMTAAGGFQGELGSLGRPFDPAEVPGEGEAPNYPPRDGALADIDRGAASRTDTLTRTGSTEGDFFAIGDASLEDRALAPRYSGGERVPPSEFREYSVTGEVPGEISTARPAFGADGGATQFRTALSARELEEAGLIQLDYEQRPATPAEAAEIDLAVAETEGRTFSDDASQMRDDIAAARAADDEALAASRGASATPELQAAEQAAEVGGELGDGAAASGGLLSRVMPWLGRGLGALGMIGGAFQTGQGVDELSHGDIDNGVVDTGAGLVGTGTGAAATGVFGDAAAAAVAAPPVAIGATVLGLASAGHHYNADHDTWGDPTVDEDGNVEHLTSVDFAEANASEAYDQAHDGVASMFADDDGNVGTMGEIAATGAGLGFGGLMGLGAGMVGFGGDLVGGVESLGSAASDLWSHWIE